MNKRHKQIFLLRDTDGKHMKRSPKSLTIREIQIQATMRQTYTPIRIAQIKYSDANKRGEDAEKLDHSCTTVANVKWYSHSGDFWSFIKTKQNPQNMQLLKDPEMCS